MFVNESKQKFKEVTVSMSQDDIEDAVHQYIMKKAPQLAKADIDSIDWNHDDYAEEGRGKNLEFVFRVVSDDADIETNPVKSGGCGACMKNCGGC